MLGWLRSNTRNVFIYGIFAIIILAFTFSLGGGGSLNSARNPNNVGAVYGVAITRRSLSNALADRERQYERLLGEQWNPDMSRQLRLAEQVLANLENQMLLRHGADDLGLTVTDTELKDEVVALPAFNVDGHFDYERYKRALSFQRRTPKQFEELLRQDLLARKMREFMLDSVHVSSPEVMEAYRHAREKIDLEYISFDTKAYEQGIDPSSADVEAFVENNKDAIQSHYDSNISEYQRPPQVRARHILIRVDPDATEEDAKEAEEKITQLAKQARAQGADFSALATEHSDDTATAVIGGDLQWVSQGQTVTPFDEAAFGANAGEIVGPIRTDFGWHVIKVEEKRPALDRKIDEVRPEIARQLLIQEKTLTMAREGADGLLEKAISEENLASLERPGPARHGTTGPFTRGSGQIPEVGVSAEGLKLAFGLTEDAPLASRVIQIDTALLIFRLKERVAAPSNPVASDLAPYRQEILTRKRQKAMQSWLDSERARAEQEGQIERNQSVLVDFFGIS